jgi:hypothetical protein
VRRPGLLCALAVLAVAGCGGKARLPSACIQADVPDVLAALRAAPAAAALSDGTRLSTCVDRAVDDAQLQSLGVTFVGAADRLSVRMPHDPTAAFELGYLVGAAERGAGATGGVQGELVQRLEQTAGFGAGAAQRRADVQRGIAAGSHDG